MNITHLHPIIVHFPIALVLVGFMTDLIYVFYKKCEFLPKTALYMEVIGSVAAVAAVLSGLFFTSPTTGYAGEIKFIHASFAIMTTVVLCIAVMLRIAIQKKYFCSDSTTIPKMDKKDLMIARFAFVLMFISAVGMFLTAMYGGKIVYDIWLMNI